MEFQQIKQAFEPAFELLIFLVAGIVYIAKLIFTTPAAAILVSSAIAGYMAWRSIKSNREMTRLRETFATLDRGNRDKEIIEARSHFKLILQKLEKKKENIAKYDSPKGEKEIREATTLLTILKDYENLALGVRFNILEEEYLASWTRTVVIHDWNALMPLVTAKRSQGAPKAYIEFERLAKSWREDNSYRTGKPLKYSVL